LSITTWLRNDDWSSSIRLWEDTVAKSPAKFRAWGNLAGSYALNGRPEDAIRCARKATELEPRFVNGSLLLSSMLISLNRSQEALAEIQRLLREDPSLQRSIDVRYNFAISLLGVGRAEESEKILAENVQAMPAHWQSHVGLGVLHRESKQWARALACWREAARYCPGNAALESLIEQTEKEEGLAAR
jgi:tetratricopeptide (TPR) repeat protein